MTANDEQQLWHQFAIRGTGSVVVETGLASFLMILAIIGNLMVCCAVYRNPRLRCLCNYYVVSLALSDILQAMLVMPFSIGMLESGVWPFSRAACYFMAISMLSLADISVYTITFMAINRYYKIVKPTKCDEIFKKSFVIKSGSLVWVMSIFVHIVCSFAFQFESVANPGFAACLIEFPTALFPIFLLTIYIPYFIMFFCYYKIYVAVKSYTANAAWQNANVENIRISKTVFIIVLGVVLLWLPCHCAFATIVLKGMFFLPRWLSLATTLLLFISSCVNPFVYGLMNRSFRREFKRILLQCRTNHIDPISS